MIRLYFNQHGDKPWSVDEGPGTQEHTFKVVNISRGLARTVYNRDLQGSQTEPCAWIEFYNCRLREVLGYAEILPL